MTEPESGDSPNMLSTIVGGLKDALKARAGKALGVVAGTVVPSMLAKSQDAKDEREGKSALRQALYRVASERAAENPQLVERVLERFVEEEFGKQERRQSVAMLAIEHLKEEVPDETASAETEMSEDWLNIFTSYAEKATSEQLQDMWGRVLAGEIRKPGSVSLKTLQVVSVLDKKTAEAAVAAFPWLINGNGLWAQAREGLSLATRRLLADSDILRSSESDTNSRVDERFDGSWFCRFRRIAVVVDRGAGGTFSYSTISTSSIGRELAKIVPFEDDMSIIMRFAEDIKLQGGVQRVRVGPYFLEGPQLIVPGVSLLHDWSRPTSG